METVNHFSHPHPLVLLDDQELGGNKDRRCEGCFDALQGCSSYTCASCKFFLHKKCAELPRRITNHPLHRRKHPHDLILLHKSPYHWHCRICDGEKGFFYECSSCWFELDINCATTTRDDQKLQHFSHNHALVLVEQVAEFQIRLRSCSGCEEFISGPFYCCLDCQFFLHKICAELPLKINSPSHRKHPLSLVAKPPSHHQGCSCYFCKNSYKGHAYYCSICEFGFKGRDVFLQPVKAETHEHPFTPVYKTLSFTCDACGIDHGYQFTPFHYTCTECGLTVHKDCLSLFKIIKITRHQHRLSHIFFFQEEEDQKRSCGICQDEVNMEFGSYCCLDCKYFVHVDCATDKFYLEDENQELKLSLPEVKDEVKHGDQRQHFSHEHILIYNDRADDQERGKNCDGCMRPIFSSFYHCAQCDFFLHQNCFELPMESRHWICKHPKILKFYRIFYCMYCLFFGSGFGYHCESCGRIMCLRCHEIPSLTFMTGRHKHHLLFDHKYKGKCCGCGSHYDGEMFKCKECQSFGLEYRCLTLPDSVWYKNDVHPLTLCTSPPPDNKEILPSQSYCDICEEERDPTQWFYHCVDCNVSTHTRCALGRSPFVKLGKPFRYEKHNKEHLVRFVKFDFNPPKCIECEKPCRDVAIQCTEASCNYIVDWMCVWEFFILG